MAPTERIVVEGLGRLPQFAHAGLTDTAVFVSGTLGTHGDRLELVGGGVGPETTQALSNIGRILAAAGVTWDEVAKVNVCLADMADAPAMNDAYGTFFTGTPPARMTVGDVALALCARVEIECVAQRPTPSHPDPTPVTADAEAPPRTTGTVERDGESLHFEVVGRGGDRASDAVPLVLSHGAGGNHAAWFQQVAHFARDRTVVVWDHRGYGRSTDHADRSGPQVAVGDLLAVLDHLGIERADLVGQSMGGWTSVGAALQRPGLARTLVLADTLGGITSETIEAALIDRPLATLPTEDTLGSHPALGRPFSAHRPELAHLYQMLGRMGTADPAVILPRLLAVTHDAAEAARLTMPVLCIVGDADPLFPPAAVRALADMLPDARVVEVTACGHSPYFESPAMWNAVVRHFLTEVQTG